MNKVELIEINFDSNQFDGDSNLLSFLESQMMSTVKKKRWYRPDLLYRGFLFSKLSKVIKTGKDVDTPSEENIIWAGEENNDWYTIRAVFNYAHVKRYNPGFFARLFGRGKEEGRFAIAIYDRSYFINITTKCACTIAPGKSFREALIAVVMFIPQSS